MQGDLTLQDTDAISRTRDASVLGGGGVDGAIHRRGGPTVAAACRKSADHLPDGMPTGEAVATTGGDLVGAVGDPHRRPVYARSATRPGSSPLSRLGLRVADELGASASVPGDLDRVYGYPLRRRPPGSRSTPRGGRTRRVGVRSSSSATTRSRRSRMRSTAERRFRCGGHRPSPRNRDGGGRSRPARSDFHPAIALSSDQPAARTLSSVEGDANGLDQDPAGGLPGAVRVGRGPRGRRDHVPLNALMAGLVGSTRRPRWRSSAAPATGASWPP